ncbi:MAG: LolA family protein [Janthinobacterium lividum]
MQRRALLTLTALWLAATTSTTGHAQAQPAALTTQDEADLARIQQYMNGVRTMKARFLQTASDGRVSNGVAWLQRPGRMRFQYDPPSPLLLVAGHGLVVFHDAQLDQTSNIPEERTPLGLLLDADIRFTGPVTVTGLQRGPGQIQVSLVRTATPQEGTLTLVFSTPPLALHSWVVLDAQGRTTTVTLFDQQFGGTFDQSLFSYVDKNFFGNDPATTPSR